jgi:hypothetical protein
VNDDELRTLILLAIQKHMSGSPAPPIRLTPDTTGMVADTRGVVALPVSISFAQYHLERATDDTMCLIEPAVQCNHCGFCKCHGH